MANKDNKNEYEYPDDGPLVPLPENVCPKCGKKYPFLEKYCSACGTKLVEENELGNYCKKGKIANVLKIFIFAAIIAAASGIFYVNQKKAVPDNPYVPPVIVAENNDSDKMRIAQLEKEKAEAEQKAAAEAKARKEAEMKAKAAKAETARIKQEKEAEEAEKKRQATAAKRAERIAEQKKKSEEARQQQKATADVAARKEKNYNVGDIIEFGSYPYYEDGTEKPIEWQILEKYSDGTALVISKYGLDNVKYNETDTDVTWETSSIRKWLNNEFYNKAFRNANKNLIIKSYIENKDNSSHNTKGGNNTFDKMFLLSIDEANKYFTNADARMAIATPFARSSNSKEGKLNYDKSDNSCAWWLRSPGGIQYIVAFVYRVGYINPYGNYADNDATAVRVAFKINLKNL